MHTGTHTHTHTHTHTPRPLTKPRAQVPDSRNPLPPQIINDHKPAHKNPPPPKPPHLAPMALNHGPHRARILHGPTNKQQTPPPIPRPVPPLPPRPRSPHAPQHSQQHRDGGVDDGHVLPRQRRRRQRVERHGTFPAGAVAHQGAQEGEGAGVEGAVVRVGGDAVGVEG